MLGSGQYVRVSRMKWVSLIFGMVLGASSIPAYSGPVAIEAEKSSFLRALETSASILPEDKRDKAFAEIERVRTAEKLSDFSYGRERADPFLKTGGVDALIREAQRPRGTLRYAKVDALLAAGVDARSHDPEGARRINRVLLDMAGKSDPFEQMLYTDAAAELAALRCDDHMLGQALSLVKKPDSPRYRLWQARMSGETANIISDIRIASNYDDTTFIRQAIDGYRLIHDFGYCSAAASPMAD